MICFEFRKESTLFLSLKEILFQSQQWSLMMMSLSLLGKYCRNMLLVSVRHRNGEGFSVGRNVRTNSILTYQHEIPIRLLPGQKMKFPKISSEYSLQIFHNDHFLILRECYFLTVSWNNPINYKGISKDTKERNAREY